MEKSSYICKHEINKKFAVVFQSADTRHLQTIYN